MKQELASMEEILTEEISTAESLRNSLHMLSPGHFHPVSKRIWAERIPPMTHSPKGNIEIPGIAQETTCYCVVLEVADDVDDVTEGQIIMVEAYDGQEIDFSGTKCLLLEHDQVKAIIDSPI